MLKEVIRYIENKDWRLQREGAKFLFYSPPAILGFEDTFLLPIPKESQSPDFRDALNDTVEFISEVYGISGGEVTHGSADYIDSLKRNAIYFKLSSENFMFQQTLEVNDIWNFLKNLSNSYTNYIKIEFSKLFSSQLGADQDKTRRALNKLIGLTRLRVIALEYKSFSVGVSADNFMGKDEIEVAEVREWRAGVVQSYKREVIDVDFDSVEEVDKLLQRFNEEERRRIFDPLISSINNSSDYYISITDSSFLPQKKLKRIPRQTVDVLTPKETFAGEPKRNVGLYRTILPIDESKPSIRLKVSDIQEDDLFTEKLDQYEVPLSRISFQGSEIHLKRDIKCQIKFEQEEEAFVAYIPEIDLKITFDNLNNLQPQVDKEISRLIEKYYLRKDDTPGEGHSIRSFLNSILPEDIAGS